MPAWGLNRDFRLSKQAALTTAPWPPPFLDLKKREGGGAGDLGACPQDVLVYSG